LQFFTPGIPQVYYVGLLAGSNDMELLERTGVGRDVNRHYYTEAELRQALDRPVVQALTRLIRFRNAHPAFDGEFSASGRASALTLTWRRDDDWAVLSANLAAGAYSLTYSYEGTERTTGDVGNLPY
jgi:sucrose phosphorylase